jgi:uncharacterized protein YkwD
VQYLEDALLRFNGKVVESSDRTTAFQTEEGPLAYVEAIEFLKVQEPIKALAWSKNLEKAAKDHVKDIGQSGQYSGIGSGKFLELIFRWITSH